MPTITITKRELNVPTSIIIEVVDVLLENEITNNIIGTDAENDELVLELEYEKEQREVIHQIEDMIADHEKGDDDDEEEE
jgi:hypothetical protein